MKTWYERFFHPENQYRPKIRYWIPNGVVSEKGIQKDIKDIAERGFGSIEVVSMTRGLPEGFFTRELMWGQRQWIEMMNVLLEEAKKYDLKVDIGNGPVWPLVDINAESADDITTLYELAYGLKILKGGMHFSGKIPGPITEHGEGTRELLAVSLYKQVKEGIIDFDSYIPLPVQETADFTLPDDGGEWTLFTFWGRPSAHKNSFYYVVDHFSEEGAKALTDLWENSFFPAFGENLQVCESLFCDSLEYRTDLDWTRTFVQDFKMRKGYSIIPYLPVLGNEVVWGDRMGNFWDRNSATYPGTHFSAYDFTDKDLQHRVNADYFEMLTWLFCHRHLIPMQKTAEKYHMNIRYQVSYNKTFEAECAALYPGIPENEGLSRPQFDNYRNMAGAVHLDRKPVYSFECAAEGFNSYGQTHEDILWWMKRAYVCGMNAQVLHGGHYCGYYDKEGNVGGFCPGVDWPGYEGFTRRTWSNAWNRTVSKEQSRQIWNYMARCNFLLRNTHKIDIAIYRNDYLNCGYGKDDGDYIYKDKGILNDYGYTYEFLTPNLLKHKNAVVNDSVLDSDGAAYKALIINNEEYLSYRAAEKILDFSKQGLPIIFVGRIPDKVKYKSEGELDKELQELIKEVNGVFVSDIAKVPETLKCMGILPDVMPDKPVPLKPVHIRIEDGDFYYIYNSNMRIHDRPETSYPNMNKKASFECFKAKVSLKGKGCIYEIDAFSGKCTKLETTNIQDRCMATLYFKEDEAKILAVLTPLQAANLGIKAEVDDHYELVDEIPLKSWFLRIKEILPPKDRIGTFYESILKDRDEVYLTELQPWNEISNHLDRTCGIGTYRTLFEMEKSCPKAVLYLENVCDTYCVSVNGIQMTFGDPAVKETDITDALQIGTNEIEITVASTLQNMASIDFLIAEEKKDKTQQYGIWGSVVIKIYNHA